MNCLTGAHMDENHGYFEGMLFGHWVKARRKKRYIKRAQLAEQLNISPNTLAKIEQGRYHPSEDAVTKMADILRVADGDRTTFLLSGGSAGQQLEAPKGGRTRGKRFPRDKAHPRDWSLANRELLSYQTSLVCRQEVIKRIKDRLQEPDVQLLTLHGPPGVGKTRAAFRVFEELLDTFPDRGVIVLLAPLPRASANLVITTIAQRLDVKEARNRTILDTLSRHLHGKELLLLLDNFEHVLEAGQSILDLVRACPGLKVLITSRSVLDLQGEYRFEVPPLELPLQMSQGLVGNLSNSKGQSTDATDLRQYGAVQLFLDRARAISSLEIDDDDLAAIVRICQQLDGLPLPIEIAAARVNSSSPHEIEAQLASVFRAKTPDNAVQHMTLWGAFDWSFNLLDDEQQTLFTRMSVFAGGCTLAAAEAVCSDGGDTISDNGENAPSMMLESITALIDKSLVKREKSGRNVRYTILETLREYGLEQLGKREEREVISERHLNYFVAMAQEAQTHYNTDKRMELQKGLSAEHGNLRAAMRWALDHNKGELACWLGGLLSPYWFFCNYFSEGRAWLEEAISHPAAQQRTKGRALALFGAGLINRPLSDFALARKYLDDSVDIWDDLIRDATSDELRLQYKWYKAFSQMVRGLTALNQYDHKAREFELESIALFEETFYPWGEALALVYLGGYFLDMKRNFKAAQPLFDRSLKLFKPIGDSWGLAAALDGVGRVSLRLGDTALALSQLKRALTHARNTGDRVITLTALHSLGRATFEAGDIPQALELLCEGLEMVRELGDKPATAWFLEEFIHIAVAVEDWHLVAQLNWARLALLEETSSPNWPFEGFEHDIEVARSKLGDTAWKVEQAVVWGMNMEQIVEYVLEKTRSYLADSRVQATINGANTTNRANGASKPSANC